MGDNSRDYEWTLDASGTLEDVLDHVRTVQLEPYPKWIRGATGMVQVEILPSEEDLADFERVRKAALVELEDVKTPFAGVCGRYVDNREGIGGYTLSVSVSAYHRING